MEKQYKRKTREVPDEVKTKISASLRGIRKSPEHCRHISKGLADYWKKIPSGKDDGGKNPIESGDVV